MAVELFKTSPNNATDDGREGWLHTRDTNFLVIPRAIKLDRWYQAPSYFVVGSRKLEA